VSFPVFVEPAFNRLEARAVAQSAKVAIGQDNLEVPGRLALVEKRTVNDDLEDMALALALFENGQMLRAVEVQPFIRFAGRCLILALHHDT
jgi:hypothetical protein